MEVLGLTLIALMYLVLILLVTFTKSLNKFDRGVLSVLIVISALVLWEIY